jgi:phosphoenolpyruvate synthase/pyruvate phosphate dikinase
MLYVKKLVSVTDHELQAVGYKAQDLATLATQVRIAPSMVVTSNAFDEVLRLNNLKYRIDYLMGHAQEYLQQTIVNVYSGARKALFEAKLPNGFETELREHYDSLTSPLSVGELVAEKERPSVRIILSTNRIDDPEDSTTIIQAVNGFDELLVAVREGWALAYAPSLLKARMKEKFAESKLKVALIIQLMDKHAATAHVYSSVAKDHGKIYIQAYLGVPDMRDTISKDYYAIGKHGLKIMASEVVPQKEQLVLDEKKDIVVRQFEQPIVSEKIVDRDLIEIARQTKKIERTLTVPVKAFFVGSQEDQELLWVNRLPFDVILDND